MLNRCNSISLSLRVLPLSSSGTKCNLSIISNEESINLKHHNSKRLLCFYSSQPNSKESIINTVNLPIRSFVHKPSSVLLPMHTCTYQMCIHARPTTPALGKAKKFYHRSSCRSLHIHLHLHLYSRPNIYRILNLAQGQGSCCHHSEPQPWD